MKQLDFTVQINAPQAKVWSTLWNDDTYRKWTAVFHEGSQAQSDWKEGSKILFLDESGQGGMSSMIARLIPNEFMSFQHLGIVKDGMEDFTTAEAKGWSGAMENYTLLEKDGGTELRVEVDSSDSDEHNFVDYFQETFPKALQRVKELAEG